MNYTYIQPNNLEMEGQVICSILTDMRNQAALFDLLKDPDIFFDLFNRQVFTACKAMFAAGKAIDTATVSIELYPTIGGDGLAKIAKIANKYTINAVQYANELISLHQKRQLFKAIHIAQEAIVNGEKADAVMNDLQKALIDAQTDSGITTTYNADALLNMIQESMVNIGKMGADALGTKIRLNSLRAILGMWCKGDLVIIAGRPAMGKTAFVETILSDFAASNKAGVFLSLEMTARQMGFRLLSTFTAKDERKYSANEIQTAAKYPTEEVLTVVYPELQRRYKERFTNENGSLLYIDDLSNVTPTQIRAKFLQIKAQCSNQIGGLVIDYLGLIDDGSANKSDNKANRIGDITRSLKMLAKEFDICVILLCQLNRALEARADKTPTLADLRDSGAIEQDADVVCFLHRPEYYRDCQDMITNSETLQTIPKAGYGEIIVAKHRNGELGTAAFRFEHKCTAIVEYEQEFLPDDVPF